MDGSRRTKHGLQDRSLGSVLVKYWMIKVVVCFGTIFLLRSKSLVLAQHRKKKCTASRSAWL